ncbi:unnamed protein product [Colias eurytheme]|nr:unnamed protein product [Colias eurytheme]
MCFLNVLRLHVSQSQRQKRLYKQYMEQLAGAYVEKCTDLTMHWDSMYNYRLGTPEWRYPLPREDHWGDTEGSRSCFSESDSGRYSSPCCSEVIFNGGQHFSGKGHKCHAVCYPGNFGHFTYSAGKRCDYRLINYTVSSVAMVTDAHDLSGQQWSLRATEYEIVIAQP